MSLKVIGAGFGRTATHSLKIALETIGFGPCYHMFEVFQKHPGHVADWSDAHRGEAVDWNSVFSDYHATVDWPAANHWEALAAAYPKAGIILTVRDPEQWYESVINTIYPKTLSYMTDDDPQVRKTGEWLNMIIWQGVFSGRLEEKQYAINVYNAHNQSVIEKCRGDRLLVMDTVFEWQSLCDFLDCPVVETPYPVSNSRQEFNK